MWKKPKGWRDRKKTLARNAALKVRPRGPEGGLAAVYFPLNMPVDNSKHHKSKFPLSITTVGFFHEMRTKRKDATCQQKTLRKHQKCIKFFLCKSLQWLLFLFSQNKGDEKGEVYV
jgi:hypothetical protein